MFSYLAKMFVATLLVLSTHLLVASVAAESVPGSGAHSSQPPDLKRAFANRSLEPVREWLEVLGEGADSNAEALRARAWLAEHEQRPDEAVSWMDQAIDATPGRPDLWVERAGFRTSRLDEAGPFRSMRIARRVREDLETALELDPSHAGALEALYAFHRRAPGIVGGSRSRAEDLAEKLAAIAPERLAWRRGLMLAEEQGPEAAIEQWARAIELADPVPTEWRVHLARELGALGFFDKALAELEPLLNDPGDPPALFEYGRLAAESGLSMEQGIEALKKYAALPPWPESPSPALAWWHKGRILDQTGSLDQARQAFKRALSLDPGLEQVRLALSDLETADHESDAG